MKNMHVTEISEKTICRAHCDYIKAQAEEIKALLLYDDRTISLNVQRALSDIEVAVQSLEELKLMFNKLYL